ncbi:MAG: hypothetical protein ACT4PT_11290 [Methanobacteriota archaeon]
MRPALLLGLLLLLGAVLSGCLGRGNEERTEPTDIVLPEEIGNQTQRRLDELAAPIPKNFVVPGQIVRSPVVDWFNGTIDPSANHGIEDRNDRGGNNYNSLIVKKDVGSFLPPGQPAEIRIKLFYFQSAGKGVDLDIFVDLPGLKTAYNRGHNDEWNWKVSVQEMTVNTVGVAGQPMEIGVEAKNGRLAQPVDFVMKMEYEYVKDVLTPYFAWAIQVPANATGLIFESAKGGGSEHVNIDFILLDPTDSPVTIQHYDDIGIPTESIFVPTKGPGEYVFYAYHVRGGFFSVKADVPVENNVLRPLAVVDEEVVDFSGPAPGMVGRNVTGSATPYTEGTSVPFAVDKFPLRVVPFIGKAGTPAVSGACEIRISSGTGLVALRQKVLRYDDERGSLGYSGDQGENLQFYPGNLAKGQYTASIVSDGCTGEIGHIVSTYAR